MSECKNCKYWEKVNYEHTDFVIGKCNKIKTYWDSTEWNKTYSGRTRIEECKNDLAFVQDGSDYHAVLMTLPDFGCVHYYKINYE